MTPLPRHLLPRSLQALADYCGERTMWLLWEHYGGGHLHVPKHADPTHPLTQLLGPDCARLIAAYGGETLTLPKADSARRAVRNAMIRRDRAAGDDLRALARRHQLTERQILTITRARDSPDDQLDLFGASP